MSTKPSTPRRGTTAIPPSIPVAAVEFGLLALRVVAGVVLAIHGLQNLSDPAGHIADTAELGVPLAPLAGWLSMLGEAGLGFLLTAGVATRVAGALAAVLMTVTWLASIAAEGLITNQPGITSESALLLGAIGLALAVLGSGRYALANALRLPPPLR